LELSKGGADGGVVGKKVTRTRSEIKLEPKSMFSMFSSGGWEETPQIAKQLSSIGASLDGPI